MKQRTFQQIYDFCLLDRTYNAYYAIPGSFECKSRGQYRYYYNSLGRSGQCRAGTYIYTQSQKQLERFINNRQQDFYFHVDKESFAEVDYQKFEGQTVYIVAHIRENGVQVEYTHPYNDRYENDRIRFTARSHNSFDKQGLIKEVRNHIDKYLLLPAGRYRDLQIQYRVPKEKFTNWYRREYRWQQERKHEQEYRDMFNKYMPEEPKMSWDNCYDALCASGAFSDFGCDEYERDDLTGQFYDMCNR